MNLEQQEMLIVKSVRRSCAKLGVGVTFRHDSRTDERHGFVSQLTPVYDPTAYARRWRLVSFLMIISSCVAEDVCVFAMKGGPGFIFLSIMFVGLFINIKYVVLFKEKTHQEIEEYIYEMLELEGFTVTIDQDGGRHIFCP